MLWTRVSCCSAFEPPSNAVFTMVLKTSKPGHDGLNTGRTLRGSGRVLGRRYAFLRCSTTAALPASDRAALDDSLGSLALPPDGVEYSLNKKGRWQIAECIRDELLPLAEAADWQVRLLEHHLRPSSSSGRTCTAFYSNAGSQKNKTPGRYMNAHSVGKEPKNANGSRSRRAHQPTNLDSAAAGVHTGVASAAGKSATESRLVQLSCDVVRSVPSCSSAVYPSRQRPAKSRKQAGPRKRQAFDVAFDLYDHDDAYDFSDEEMDCDDEHPSIASASAVPPTECPQTEPHLEFSDRHEAHGSDSPSASAADGSDEHSLAYVRPNHSVQLRSDMGSDDVLCICGRTHEAPKAARRPRSSRRARAQAVGDGATPPGSAAGEKLSAALLPPAARACSGSLPVTVQIPCNGDADGDVMQLLSRNFGEQYAECRCQPRTCTVELRNVARRVAQTCRCRRTTCRLSAYLVVQQLPKAPPATYSVWLSANLKTDVELGTLSSGGTYTVQELIDCVEAFLLSLPHDRFSASLDVLGATVSSSKKWASFNVLSAVRCWSVACQTLDDVQQELVANVARLQEENERNAKATSENLVLIPAVAQRSVSTCQTQCGSCFEEVGSCGAGVKAVALSECGHSFCLDCWRAYVNGKVAEGQSLVQCPEYRCCALVDHATILAICGPDVAMRYRMQQAEVMVWKQGNVKWCPNPYCRRLVRVQRAKPQAAGRGEAVCVSCTCGKTFCFDCLAEPHWPLTCEQAGSYHTVLKQQGLFVVTLSMASSIRVLTKPCPACHYPIEKSAGCNHMFCTRCTAHFCWRCLAVLPNSGIYDHVNTCRLEAAALQDHEFSAALTWSHSSSLASQATSNRMYKSAATARFLEKKLSALLGRTKFSAISEYLSHVSAASPPSPKHDEQLADVRKRLHRTLIAFKLDAHHIMEYSLACLAMGPRTAASDSAGGNAGDGGSSGATAAAAAPAAQTKKRAQAELNRLAFVLERFESLLVLLSADPGPQPTVRHLRHVDDLAAAGERSLQSLVRLMASYQGY